MKDRNSTPQEINWVATREGSAGTVYRATYMGSHFEISRNNRRRWSLIDVDTCTEITETWTARAAKDALSLHLFGAPR